MYLLSRILIAAFKVLAAKKVEPFASFSFAKVCHARTHCLLVLSCPVKGIAPLTHTVLWSCCARVLSWWRVAIACSGVVSPSPHREHRCTPGWQLESGLSSCISLRTTEGHCTAHSLAAWTSCIMTRTHGVQASVTSCLRQPQLLCCCGSTSCGNSLSQ